MKPLQPRFLASIFFLSGFAALIYQVTWQRILFTLLGSHIESVSLIVAIFMLGLGLGGLLGGWVAKAPIRYLPQIFVVTEFAIAVFGISSPQILHGLGQIALGLTIPSKASLIFLTLFGPTALMGLTLPLLVEYINHFYQNTGETISQLYFINTLGAASAAFATVLLFLTIGGIRTTLWLAASLNLLTALLIAYYSYSRAWKVCE